MNWRGAAVRAVRTFLQGAAATLLAFYLAVKDDGTFVNIKAHGAVLAFGFFLSLVAAVVAFVQNVIEDNSNTSIPK